VHTREELLGQSPITLGQACLTLEFFADGLLEKKLQLVGMSILLILLSPRSGCYNELPLDAHHLGVLSGASKMIPKPMVHLAQTVHLSSIDTNTIPNKD
jgi:hypothetical protein